MKKIHKEIKAFLPLLQILKRLKSKDSSILLSHLNEDSIHFLGELIFNCTSKDSILSPEAQLKLARKLHAKKSCFRFISNPKNCILKRKTKLEQSGGSLGLILAAAIPALINLISGK